LGDYAVVYVVSFVCLKGGVGKTTLATNIAANLARDGRETLLVELDYPSVSRYVFSEGEIGVKLRRTLFDVLKARVVGTSLNLADAIVGSERWGRYLHVVVGGDGLDTFERDALRVENWLRLLDDALYYVRGVYKFVILDCPPRLGPLTRMAVYASDYYVVPTIPDALNLKRAQDTIDLLERFVERYMKPRGRTARCIGVILNRRKKVSHHEEMAEEARKLLGPRVFRNSLGDSIAYAVSLKEHIPIYMLKSHYRKAAEQLEAVYKEFLARLAALTALGE